MKALAGVGEAVVAPEANTNSLPPALPLLFTGRAGLLLPVFYSRSPRGRFLNIHVIIPAPYQSGRLPGKPLIDISGLPMIERTWRQCIQAFPKEKVTVATDDSRIAGQCVAAGMPFLMTSPDCPTGTDRVAEAAEQIGADYYINVQGDEPLINPDDIRSMATAAEKDPSALHLGICEITEEDQYRDTSIPKAVFRQDRRLLYVSRASIPAPKSLEFQQAWRPVWVYGFPPQALKAYTSLGRKTPIEAIEDSEIIRFLELGYEVRLVEMTSESIAVNVLADVEEVKRVLARRASHAG